MSIIDDFKKWLSDKKITEKTVSLYISCLKQNEKWGLTGELGVFQYTSVQLLKPHIGGLRKAANDISGSFEKNFNTALNFYFDFLNEKEIYIDIFSDQPYPHNITGFRFNPEYLTGKAKTLLVDLI
jgi:hypothetical protein